MTESHKDIYLKLPGDITETDPAKIEQWIDNCIRVFRRKAVAHFIDKKATP